MIVSYAIVLGPAYFAAFSGGLALMFWLLREPRQSRPR
jgi:hypothetical protein